MKYRLLIALLVLVLSGCDLITKDLPKLTLNPGIDTIEINSNFVDAGAKAFVGISELEVIVTENTVDITKVGTYIVIYQATFDNENYTITRIIDVIDETPPIVKLNPGIDTIKLNQDWIDAGVTASDNSNNDITIITSGIVNTSVAGEYEITYTAIDESKNETLITRYVNVIE